MGRNFLEALADAIVMLARAIAMLVLWITAVPGVAALPLEQRLADRIDRFVATETSASGIPGVAVAVLQEGRAPHVRGFGHDGRGSAITGDTAFPIGSLTKSFTALLIRQAIEAGQLDADAPVQRYLPWFRVADARASSRITVRHLLNQTSGLSRADGMTALLAGRQWGSEDLKRNMRTLRLSHAVGERFEYSNLNYVLLGAVLQAVTGDTWDTLVRERVLRPLAMTHSNTDSTSARHQDMGRRATPERNNPVQGIPATAVHRIWFGIPVAHQTRLPPGMAPAGSLVASANDMVLYLRMLLAGGMAPAGRVLSAQGVAQLLAPGSAPARSTLLSSEFAFRYGEGWFVGSFGAAADARWHLGNLASFVAWMVLLPESKQAVVVLINANSELPLGAVNAVMSRLPIGVVNLLQGQAPPTGPSLRQAYRRLNLAVVAVLVALAALAWRAWRARSAWPGAALALLAAGVPVALCAIDMRPALLATFAPDLGLALVAAMAVLCGPLAWRLGQMAIRTTARP